MEHLQVTIITSKLLSDAFIVVNVNINISKCDVVTAAQGW